MLPIPVHPNHPRSDHSYPSSVKSITNALLSTFLLWAMEQPFFVCFLLFWLLWVSQLFHYKTATLSLGNCLIPQAKCFRARRQHSVLPATCQPLNLLSNFALFEAISIKLQHLLQWPFCCSVLAPGFLTHSTFMAGSWLRVYLCFTASHLF